MVTARTLPTGRVVATGSGVSQLHLPPFPCLHHASELDSTASLRLQVGEAAGRGPPRCLLPPPSEGMSPMPNAAALLCAAPQCSIQLIIYGAAPPADRIEPVGSARHPSPCRCQDLVIAQCRTQSNLGRRREGWARCSVSCATCVISVRTMACNEVDTIVSCAKQTKDAHQVLHVSNSWGIAHTNAPHERKLCTAQPHCTRS